MSTSRNLSFVRPALERCIEQTARHPEAARLALLATRDAAAMREAVACDALFADDIYRGDRGDGADGADGADSADSAEGADGTGGGHVLPLAGMVLVAKACFDVAGWVSHAGSRVLAGDAPAAHDAPLVSRLRQAGAILRAQTNMTEFAYGALGVNPWYGTPITPLMPQEPCVAGGSSSGSAVAVALGMADLAVCSDTSGSARIPAAFCGVAGFKPSRGRYPDAGMLHLSTSFDVPGLIAASMTHCRRADRALAGALSDVSPGASSGPLARIQPHASLHGLRLVVPETWLSGLLDDAVGSVFEHWLAHLSAAGAQLRTLHLPLLADAGRVASEGGMIAAEAYQLHAARLAGRASEYDPRVGPRILLGAEVRAHLYVAAQRRLGELAGEYDDAMAWADAVVTPTVPMLPPSLARLADDASYAADNRRAFQLTEFANRLDLPSASLPGDLARRGPIGLLLTGRRGGDTALLAAATSVERALSMSG